MKVRLWGTRGSLATPDVRAVRYGGNTSCVEVRGEGGGVLVLDAGTGIRTLGAALGASVPRVDVLLSHLHMDHIQGLGFFAPLYQKDTAVHIWGPASTTLSLRDRLMRYLSPPLFPVRLRDLPCKLFLHEVPADGAVGEFHVTSSMVCHPGPTVGYRIAARGRVVTYLPDHEPALGVRAFPNAPDWTSGYALAAGADLLIHDAQYTDDEYARTLGWGHSTLDHALDFATLAGVAHLVPFHHDPSHDDDTLDRLFAASRRARTPSFLVTPAAEGQEFVL